MQQEKIPKTFDIIEKECTWCHNKFKIIWKRRYQQMCSRKCMYEWRKAQNWEDVVCKNCKKIFKRRKKDLHWRSGKKRMFCSNECSLTSNYKKKKLRKWALSKNNHWNTKKSQGMVKITKLKRYGDANYNNMEKQRQTMLDKYGVVCPFQLSPSNGHTISKPQKKVYKFVKSIHKDAKLEHFLKDAEMSVDIYIPEINTVIEVNGDYWHMNPIEYKSNDYNKNVHLTAKEIWQRDEQRVSKLKSNGYRVISLWEKDINDNKHELIIE